MTKPPPYQPTPLQSNAQSQAQRMAQQQAYLTQAITRQHSALQQQQVVQQTTGVQHGGYWYTGTATSNSTLGPAHIAYVGAAGTIVYSAQSANCASQSYPPIEEAGIRAGEIIGYRAWCVKGGDTLVSMFVEYEWLPGIQKISERLKPVSGNGFHAFKDMDRCYCEYYGRGIVYGKVALWGEVIEHERGYRAECARIIRLSEITETEAPSWLRYWRQPTIQRLREKYGVIE